MNDFDDLKKNILKSEPSYITWHMDIVERHEKLTMPQKQELIFLILDNARKKSFLPENQLERLGDLKVKEGFLTDDQKNALFCSSLKGRLNNFVREGAQDSVMNQWRDGSSFILTVHKFGFGREHDEKGFITHTEIEKAYDLARQLNSQYPYMKPIKIALDLDLLFIFPEESGTDFENLPQEKKDSIISSERYADSSKSLPNKVYLKGQYKSKVRLFFGHRVGISPLKTGKELFKSRHTWWMTGIVEAEYVFKNYMNAPKNILFSIEIKKGHGDHKEAFRALLRRIKEIGMENRVMFQSRFLDRMRILKEVLKEEGLDQKIPVTFFTKYRRMILRPPFYVGNGIFHEGSFHAITDHLMPNSLEAYDEYVKNLKKQGLFSYPFIVEPKYSKNKFPMIKPDSPEGKKVKKKLLMSMLSGCTGGFIGKDCIDVLVDFAKDPLDEKQEMNLAQKSP